MALQTVAGLLPRYQGIVPQRMQARGLQFRHFKPLNLARYAGSYRWCEARTP